jgi:hypothetical protein
MPGATEAEFFERADLMDNKIGQAEKDDPAAVARQGYDAMMRGVGDVVTGWKNKLQSAIANVTPSSVLAEMHRKQTEPGRPSRGSKGVRARLRPSAPPVPFYLRPLVGPPAIAACRPSGCAALAAC